MGLLFSRVGRAKSGWGVSEHNSFMNLEADFHSVIAENFELSLFGCV